MNEIYRLQILESQNNPTAFELRFSAKHGRNQLLVMFLYKTSPGIAERLKINRTGDILVKIRELTSRDKVEDRFFFICSSPIIGQGAQISGEYSVRHKIGFLRILLK